MHNTPTLNDNPNDKLNRFQFVATKTPTTTQNLNSYCRTPGCLNGIGKRRAALGHTVCKECGEAAARRERKSWCVVQEYGKGGYMLVTANSARTTLKQTNQKATRS